MNNELILESKLQAEPDAETLAILDCLQEAVSEALERKRRLGQYYAQWTPEGVQLIGPDAPKPDNSTLWPSIQYFRLVFLLALPEFIKDLTPD